MAVTIIDNFEYLGRNPDFTRQQYNNISDLKAVKDGKMPQMYLVYCLEDRSLYLYDKANETSSVTGKFRKFTGGGQTIQVTEMPVATEAFAERVLQFVGITNSNYVKGYFYSCDATPVPITTIAQFKTFIAKQDSNVDIKLNNESVVSVKCYENGGIYYFVYEDSLYFGTLTDNVIILASASVITTDGEVEALGFTDLVYSWENLSVSPGGGEPASITIEEVDELFEN